MDKKDSTVSTKFWKVKGETKLECGESLDDIVLAYETYGELSPQKDNAVLVFHALSGSQHLAGYNDTLSSECRFWTPENYQGWWSNFVGPGCAFDTNKNFIICCNYIGGCYGSTGPNSIDPKTSKPYGSKFPRVSVSDIVDTQYRLVSEHLGIKQLKSVVGPSLGGLLSLNLSCRYPDISRSSIMIATGMEVSMLQRIQRFEQIRAIENDPNFAGGDYYDGEVPGRGLSLARMIAHKSYVSLQTLLDRANKEIRQEKETSDRFYEITSSIESYMLHQGNKFVERFDANSYLRIADAWQRMDLLRDCEAKTYNELFSRLKSQKFTVFSIDSDVCFYPEEQKKLVKALESAGVDCTHITVHSLKGHDAFLIEPELFAPYVTYKLDQD